MTTTTTRTGDVLYINCSTSFGWWDRLRILFGSALLQRITVRTDLPEIGPHTIETVAKVGPLATPRAPGPMALDAGGPTG